MTLNDVQGTARPAYIRDRRDDENGHIFDSDEQEHEPAEEVALDFHDLQDSVWRGTPALRAARDLCTKHNVRKSPS